MKSCFAEISLVPVIFNEQWKYQEEASWYLRDRAKGEAFATVEQVRRFPTPDSLGTYARALTDFLEWCDWVKKRWQDVAYKSDLIDRYQTHMQSGIWSVSQIGLMARTVNQRVDEATLFLQWAARQGLRPLFLVPTSQTQRRLGGPSARGRTIAVTSRAGRVRPDPIDLRIPSSAEVDRWLNYIRLKKGATKALMCELVIETGIREQECAQWRTFTLSNNKDNWDIADGFVSLKIEYGAKGQKRLNERGDIVGPRRRIAVPLALAEKLHAYGTTTRIKSRMKYVNGAETGTERRRRQLEREERLFLSEYDGRPITADTLYKAWAHIPSEFKPYTEWSPHLGRHYWACTTLWNAYLEREAMLAEGVVPTSDWVAAGGSSDLLLVVKPQLGHVDVKTTQAYLVWLRQMARAHFGSRSSNQQDYEEWLEK